MFLVKVLKKIAVVQQLTYYFDEEKKTEIVLQRFYLFFKENRWFNLCIHRLPPTPSYQAGQILHNHPWFNISIILKGGYCEYRQDNISWVIPGNIIFRQASVFHNIFVDKKTCWTIFIKFWVVQDQSFLIDGIIYKSSDLKVISPDFS